MNKIKLNKNIIKMIIADLKNKVVGGHIGNVTIINSTCVVLSFSFYRKGKLLISLDKNAPYISEINDVEMVSTIDGGFSSQLRHHIRDAYIFDIKLINDDSIICFELKQRIDEFTIEDKFMYVELIPLKPNIIVTRKDQSVVFATHYGNKDEKRSLVTNQIYLPPAKEIREENNEIPSLDDINKYGIKIYEKALIKRKKERFENVFKLIKNKIKLLNRKIPVLEKEITDGEEGLSYQDLGNACYYMDIEELISLFKASNKEYDQTLSSIDNANLCFKRYKKSKHKIQEANKQLEIALKDLEYYQHLLDQCDIGNEEDLGQIQAMLFPNKKVKPQERKILKNKGPYQIKLEKSTILFGRNDVQNDNLTFKLAHYKDTFVHISNYPGAHIIIKSDKLDDETLLTACEIALLLSKKDDGDIDYTEVKNVKKTEKLGLVKIKEHKTVHLNNIRNSTKQLLKLATKRG